MRFVQVGSWAEVAKIHRCWCWLGGAAWIHGMGLGFLAAWKDLAGSFGVEAFVANVASSIGVGPPVGVWAWEGA